MHSTKDAKEAEFPSQDSVTNSQNIRERERGAKQASITSHKSRQRLRHDLKNKTHDLIEVLFKSSPSILLEIPVTDQSSFKHSVCKIVEKEREETLTRSGKSSQNVALLRLKGPLWADNCRFCKNTNSKAAQISSKSRITMLLGNIKTAAVY